MKAFIDRFLYLSDPSSFSNDLADVEGQPLVVHKIRKLSDNFFG